MRETQRADRVVIVGARTRVRRGGVESGVDSPRAWDFYEYDEKTHSRNFRKIRAATNVPRKILVQSYSILIFKQKWPTILHYT